MNIPNIELNPCKADHYLAAESVDRLRTYSKHQGHTTNFRVIKAHDGTLHLIALATVIAATPIAEAGETVEPLRIGTALKINIDGVTYNIADDRPLHDPYLVVA